LPAPTDRLPICSFKWGDRYTAAHLTAMRDMLARNLTIAHEFCVISDREADAAIPGVRYIPLWTDMRGTRGCGVRLRAFGADMATIIGPRFAWIDLDLVILSNVDHIFSRPEPFVALRPPRPPMPYQGSLVIMDAGARAGVLDQWTPQEYERRGDWLGKRYGIAAGTVSDEGWMWSCLSAGEPDWPWTPLTRGEAQIGPDARVYFWKRDLDSGRLPPPPGAAIIVMNGRMNDPSFAACRRRAPWIAKHWRP
jgi:hypothetical protein